jgi:hypothetical protein
MKVTREHHSVRDVALVRKCHNADERTAAVTSLESIEAIQRRTIANEARSLFPKLATMHANDLLAASFATWKRLQAEYVLDRSRELVWEGTVNRIRRVTSDQARGFMLFREEQETVNRASVEGVEAQSRRHLLRQSFAGWERARYSSHSRATADGQRRAALDSEQARRRDTLNGHEQQLRTVIRTAFDELLNTTSEYDPMIREYSRERERIIALRERDAKTAATSKSEKASKEDSRMAIASVYEADRIAVNELNERMKICDRYEPAQRAGIAAMYAPSGALASTVAAFKKAEEKLQGTLRGRVSLDCATIDGWRDELPCGKEEEHAVPLPLLVAGATLPLCPAASICLTLTDTDGSSVTDAVICARVYSAANRLYDCAVACSKQLAAFEAAQLALSPQQPDFGGTAKSFVNFGDPRAGEKHEPTRGAELIATRVKAVRRLADDLDASHAPAGLGVREFARITRAIQSATASITVCPDLAPGTLTFAVVIVDTSAASFTATVTQNNNSAVVLLKPKPPARSLTANDVTEVLQHLRVTAAATELSAPTVITARCTIAACVRDLAVVHDSIVAGNSRTLHAEISSTFVVCPRPLIRVASEDALEWRSGEPPKPCFQLEIDEYPVVTGTDASIHPGRWPPLRFAIVINSSVTGVPIADDIIAMGGQKARARAPARDGTREVRVDGKSIGTLRHGTFFSASSVREAALRTAELTDISGLLRPTVILETRAGATARELKTALESLHFTSMAGRQGNTSLTTESRIVSLDVTLRGAHIHAHRTLVVHPPALDPQLVLPEIVSVVPAASGEVSDVQAAWATTPGGLLFTEASLRNPTGDLLSIEVLQERLTQANLDIEITRGCLLGDELDAPTSLFTFAAQPEEYDDLAKEGEESGSTAASSTCSPASTSPRTSRWGAVANRVQRREPIESAAANVNTVAIVKGTDSVGKLTREFALFPKTSHERRTFSDVALSLSRIAAAAAILNPGVLARGRQSASFTSKAGGPKSRLARGLTAEVPDVTFPDHAGQTPNRPKALRFTFEHTTLEEVLAVIRSTTFTNVCLSPMIGVRHVTVRITGTLARGAELCFEGKSAIVVRPPLIQVPRHLHTMKFVNGCGWKRLNVPRVLAGSKDWLKSRPDTASALARGLARVTQDASIADSAPRITAIVYKLIVGAEVGDNIVLDDVDDTRGTTTRERCPFELIPTSECNAVPTDPANGGGQGADRKIYDSFDIITAGEVIARASYRAKFTSDDLPTLSIDFVHAQSVTSAYFSALISRIAVRFALIPESALSQRDVQMTCRLQNRQDVHCFYTIFVSSYDEPSEIVLAHQKIQHRHGLVPVPVEVNAVVDALPSGKAGWPRLAHPAIGATPIAPLSTACIHDPDTDFFDGGFLKATLVQNGARGDTLRLLSAEEQAAQYAITTDADGADAMMIDVPADGSEGKIVYRGVLVGTVQSIPDELGIGFQGLRVDFAEKLAGAQKSLVPIALASYVLNCIAFECRVENAKNGPRTIRLAVADSQRGIEGAVELDVEVLLPFVAAIKVAGPLTHSIGGVPAALSTRVQAFLGKDDRWTQGYLAIILAEDAASNNSEAADGGILHFNPMLFPQVSFKVGSDGAMVDNLGAYMGALQVTPQALVLLFDQASAITQKQLEGFVRCVSFENRDAMAAQRKAVREVYVAASDGTAKGMANVARLAIQLKGTTRR